MLLRESGPDPFRARRLGVPLLEGRLVRRLPLLCMCVSFVGTSYMYPSSLNDNRIMVTSATLNLFLVPSTHEHIQDSSRASRPALRNARKSTQRCDQPRQHLSDPKRSCCNPR